MTEVSKNFTELDVLKEQNVCLLRENANLKALIRDAIDLIEDFCPALGNTTVDVGKLNTWLLATKEYDR